MTLHLDDAANTTSEPPRRQAYTSAKDLTRRRGAEAVVRAAPLALSAAAFIHGTLMSWRKFGSLVVDTGRALDVPRQLLEGRLLYRDVRFYWGPLGPYLNAGLYRLFGVSIDVEMWAGIAAAALMLLALYKLGTRFAGSVAGAAVGIAFVYAGAFPRTVGFAIFNFVLPFNCDATYGIVAAGWCLVLLIDHVDSDRATPFLLSALLLALTALAKAEVFLPAFAAHAVFAMARNRRLRRVHAVGWAIALAVVAGVYGFFASRAPGFFAESLGGPVNRASDFYIRRTMGLMDLREGFRDVGWSILSLAIIAAAAYGLGRALLLPAVTRVRWLIVLAFAAAVAGLEALAIGPGVALRAMPFLLVAALVAIAVAWWRGGEDAWLSLGLVSVFALACFPRIPLRAWPTHYGFYLLPPSFVCLVALSAPLARRISGDPWVRRAFLAGACGVLLGLGLAMFRMSQQWFGHPHDEMHTTRGTLLVQEGSPEPMLVDALARYPKGTRAIVVPEGIGLVFASGLEEGDSWVTYLPMHVPDDAHDAMLAAEWTANPPDVVLVWRTRNLWQFGYRGFGIDYAKRAAAVLDKLYTVRKGYFGEQFLLLERKR